MHEAVDSTVAKIEGDVRSDSEIATLNVQVLKLDLSSHFDPEAAESIISAIASLAPKGDERRLSKLEFALDTSAMKFASAGRLDLVIRLERLAPDWFLRRATIVETMVQAFGFTLLADADAPTSWTDSAGSRREIYTSYRKYVNMAELIGYPETYLLFEMLLGHIGGLSPEAISNLIEETDDLSETDARHFVQVMTSLGTGGMTIEPTAKSKRVASRVAAFLCEHKEDGQLIEAASEQVAPLSGSLLCR